MTFNIDKVKIIVMVPINNVEEIRKVACEEGAGIIGNYSYCTTSVKVTGTFMPNDKSNPFIGEKNKLEYVEEEKLEFICEVTKVKKVLQKIRDVHPYEEPGIDIIPLINESNFC